MAVLPVPISSIHHYVNFPSHSQAHSHDGSSLASYITYLLMPGVPLVGAILECLPSQYLPFTDILWRGAEFQFLLVRLHSLKLSLRVGHQLLEVITFLTLLLSAVKL